MPLSDRRNAQRRPSEHRFVPGRGYVRIAGEPFRRGTFKTSCAPPPGTADGTRHFLLPPGGGEKMPMIWRPGTSSWQAAKLTTGNRMAWTVAYLNSHGWRYDGAAEDWR